MLNHALHALTFAVLLFGSAAAPFQGLATVLLACYLLYSLLRPLESPFYPIMFAGVVVLSLITVHSLGSPVAQAAVSVAFGVLFLGWRYLRFLPPHSYRIYLAASGFAIMTAAGHVFYSDPNVLWTHRQVLLGLFTAVVLFEFFGLWGRLYPERSLVLRRRVLVSALLGFIVLELHWGLSLLPIGFLNNSALLGLFVFFGLDMFWRFHHGVLTPRHALRNAGLIAVVSGIVLGLSHWSI